MLSGGILPFGAIFPELYFILTSIWHHRFYYLFGFLGVVLIILVVTCAEISIALTYFQLTQENHKWWWKALCGSGGSGIYMLVYAYVYYQKLGLPSPVATMVYIGYTVLMSGTMFLYTGTIGVISSFLFVKAIYGSIKVD